MGSTSGSSGPTPAAVDHPELRAFAAHMRGLGVECWGWGLGFVFDLLALRFIWPAASWRQVLLCRAVGLPVQPLVVWLAKRDDVSPVTVGALAVAHTWVLVVLMALQAVEFGGLESPYLLGVMTFATGGALLSSVKARWIVRLEASWFALWTLTLAVTSLWDRRIAAQWTSPRALVVFTVAMTFLMAGSVWIIRVAGQLQAALRELHQARRLASYRLKAHLGAGGMNEVWLAWDERAKRDVALKIMRGSPTATAAERFAREARSTRELRSPHTVRVLDAGASDDGVLFLAMEYLDGVDLERLVRSQGPLPAGRAIALVRQACESLREAHARGIVHRDLKPSNMMLTVTPAGDDHLKVVDFGIAGSTAADTTQLTQDGVAVGTPHFMSPEALEGAAADVGMDVYGLGATLYFLLTGVRPFEGLSGYALMNAVASQRPALPSSQTTRPISPELDELVMYCLARAPADRPPSVDALVETLMTVKLTPWDRDQARLAWNNRHHPVTAPDTSSTPTRDDRPRRSPPPAAPTEMPS